MSRQGKDFDPVDREYVSSRSQIGILERLVQPVAKPCEPPFAAPARDVGQTRGEERIRKHPRSLNGLRPGARARQR